MADEWTNWTRDDWNSKLLHAVFAGSGESITPVVRLNATEGFLTSVAQADPNSGRDVAEKFIGVHKGPARMVRNLFDPYILLGWDPTKDEPKFFSQLYLTLIVASATSETHSEGNFRRRLAILLGMDPDLDYVPSGLPKLWQALALWSAEQSKQGKSIRLLRLPDPGRETIIGYSKRLAFPMYRDQVQLARVLAEKEVNSESPIEEILNVVGRSIRSFSTQFGEEYQQFRRAAEESDPDAAATPFWGALEETTWSSDRVLIDSRRPKVQVELEIASGTHPTFELLVDRLDCEDLPRGWRIEPLPFPVSGFAGYLMSDDESLEGEIGPSILGLHSVTSALLRGNYIEQEIRQGCLCFAPGESIAWTSRSYLPSSGVAWLVMRDDIAREAKDVLLDHGVTYWESIHGAENWLLVGPFDCSMRIAGASWRRPFVDLTVFKKTISRSSVSIRGAIRLSDGLLFLKPAIPTVFAQDVEAVEFGFVGQEETGNRVMSESPNEAHSYMFPPDTPKGMQVPGTLVLAAYRDGQLVQAKRIETIGACSFTAGRPPNDIDGWLIEDDCGQTSAINASLEPREAHGENTKAEYWLRSDSGQRYLNSIRGDLTESKVVTRLEWLPIDSIPSEWSDVFECFAGLLTCRSGIDYRTALDLLVKGLGLESEKVAAVILAGIVGNHHLIRLYSRRWRGQRFFCRTPVLVTNNSEAGLDVRIIGLVTKLTRARLVNEARSLGLSASIAVLGDWAHSGVIRVEGATKDVAAELASRMGIDLNAHMGDVDPVFLESPRNVLAQISNRIDIDVSTEEKKFWDTKSNAFWGSTPKLGASMEANYLEKQQPVYVLRFQDEPIWATQSRSWASIVAQYMSGGLYWELSSSGVLVTPYAAPDQFARYAVLKGAGVCGADWMTDYRSWYYPFAGKERATSYLKYWIDSEDRRTEPEAVIRWANAMENTSATKSQISAFRNRYTR